MANPRAIPGTTTAAAAPASLNGAHEKTPEKIDAVPQDDTLRVSDIIAVKDAAKKVGGMDNLLKIATLLKD